MKARVLFTLIIFLGSGMWTSAIGLTAKIILKSSTLSDFQIRTRESEVNLENEGLTTSLSIRIAGLLSRPDSTLLIHDSIITKTESKPSDFEHRFALSGPTTPMTYTIVDAAGKVSKVDFEILCPSYEETIGRFSRRSFRVSPTVGFSTWTYQETGRTTFQSNNVEAGLELFYQKYSWPFELRVSGRSSVAPISKNQAQQSMMPISLRGGAEYQTHWLSSPWRLYLGAFYFYYTILATPKDVGYSRIQGAQIAPRLEKDLSLGQSLFLEFQYGWIAPLSPINAEISGQLGYRKNRFGQHSWGARISFENLLFNSLDNTGGTISVRSNRIALLFDYGI